MQRSTACLTCRSAHRIARRLAIAIAGLLPAVPLLADEPFELRPHERICLIGNTLAERMQHFGWLETAVTHRFPKHDLVFRNLAFSGDELATRLRSANFGSPDDHLAENQADVVWAFFGYNESFAGEAGIDAFRAELARWIEHTQSQTYNGRTPPRIVLFSPIAHEPPRTPDRLDPAATNQRLERYTAVMQQIAQQYDVRLVDLFHPTQAAMAASSDAWTINGIHLNEAGDRRVAELIEEALFGESLAHAAWPQLEPLRQAILDKNFHWFQRYRTTDGYSIFGGRADLAFVEGQTNREVMQREMRILWQMTENRDRRVWALARGQDAPLDDSNTDPFIPVVTNKPGSGPGGTHVALNEADSLAQIRVADGFRVEWFASEIEFPELVNPVQMAFDTRGRLWVATWPTYPHWKPKTEMNDRLVILEDRDGDGRADHCQTFAGGLHNPTGFEFYGRGVIVAQGPDLLYLEDTDGDDVADIRHRILHGLDTADTHHTANSFCLDPGGALYFQEGTFHHTQVETPYGPSVRSANAAVYRFEPRTSRFEVYAPFPFANPHGHVFDRWGQDIVHDGTSSVPYHGTLISGYLPFPEKHASPPAVYAQRTRPCPGSEILSSRHFPSAWQGNLLVGNVIGVLGLLQYRIEDDGASFRGVETELLFSSSDESFRPVDFEIGPDGALYFIDWYNPIIGHMQHNLRDPSRDKMHGRVYRVVCVDRPLLDPLPIAGEPIETLLERLREPEDRVRMRAKIELSGRPAGDVIAAARRWIEQLDRSDPEFEHHLLEGLWVHQWMNVVDAELLVRLLAADDFRARAAAVRVLCAWRDRLDAPLELLRRAARDPHPRVRLEAVRAASWMPAADAVDIPLLAAAQPLDRFLEFQIAEAIRGLRPLWRQALLEGRALELSDPPSLSRLLAALDAADLIRMPGQRAVDAELLFRTGIADSQRRKAVAGLAAADQVAPLDVIFSAIRQVDADDSLGDSAVINDLVGFLSDQPAAALKARRDAIRQLCLTAERPLVRQIGYVALIAADGEVESAWETASAEGASRLDLVQAAPLVVDPNAQAALYPKLRTLVEPPAPAAPHETPAAPQGRYVRIELGGPHRVLTLAEVEIYSQGVNVAPSGTASQKNTAHGGAASRAIDGNRSGIYGEGGQTHSEDPTTDPWWELDLGRSLPIEEVRVFNRTEGNFAQRLEGFTLRVLDEQRRDVALLSPLPAPRESATYPLEPQSPERTIRQAAFAALASIRGHESETVGLLVPWLAEPRERAAALQALQRIAPGLWPAEAAAATMPVLLDWIQSVPEAQRSGDDVVRAVQVADALAGQLPKEQAAAARRLLGNLGVRIVRIGTVPHRMIYDVDAIVVPAGRPVEIHFENSDLMPHNLVITRPGALERVGLLAESTAGDPGAPARHYVPASDDVLLSSRLLQTRQTERLPFRAPSEPGVYPIVCTYPGHWRTMYAAMHVVADWNAYLDDPAAYLAQHPLPAADPMLASRRPRTEWALADLQPVVRAIAPPKSFDNGRRMFQVANCVGCHQLGGQGVQFGADLARLDESWTAEKILQAIVEPSHEINQDYQTWRILMIDGKTFTGLVLREDDQSIELVENPLVKGEPVRLAKEDIEERSAANRSIMPEGLLDRLSEHEVLDLMAFLIARGDPNHPLFDSAESPH